VAFAVVATCSVVLKFTWYDNLERREKLAQAAAPLPEAKTA
jgi:hypothetical protein